jgi:hypothetical protein
MRHGSDAHRGREETGMRFVDVWESEEQFERFLEVKLPWA